MKFIVRLLVLVFVFGTLTYATAHFSPKQYSASLSSVSVTLSNSRLSFRGALNAGNTSGSTVAYINTTPNAYPSTASSQLVEGDTVRIGAGATMTTAYTVDDSYNNTTNPFRDEDKIYVSTGLNVFAAGSDVISTQSAILTTKLTTVDAIANGRFRVLVPALANNGAAGDGIPDGGYYDFGAVAPGVTCPADVASLYDFVAGTASVSAITVGAGEYHSFECAYSGPGSSGAVFDGVTYGAFVIGDVTNKLINPAPTTNHQQGVADTYRIIVQHLDANFNTIDQTTVAVGVIEAVKVTATVAPQITFKILGVNSGTDVCGFNTSVTTSAALVPFGDLLISSFTNAAQGFSISTNAASGYSVTALENDQMGRNGMACPSLSTDCIPDTTGDAANITSSSAGLWATAAAKGFGFTLDNKNSVANLTLPFQHDTATNGAGYNCSGNSGGGCTSGNCHCYRSFPSLADSGTSQVIGSAAIPVDNHNFYLCYRGVISTTQAAGYYENYITYIATATF